MNKYDQKVIQYATEEATIYELIPKKIHGKGRNIFDLLTGSVLLAGPAVKQLQTRESFYLVMNEKKAELVTITKNLTHSKQDITNSVNLASGKKYFEYDGYRYKLFRKVK